MKLHISETLALPLDFIVQTQAILAIKRVGKSYTASVQAEELLKAGQQIVAIDVTGAWWGLRSNAAGDGPGFPILIAGGDHADIPLEETAGEVLAEAIVTERFSAIIDVSLFRKAQAQRFLAVFFETLYRRNREAMHLFMDEADFYAPQKPFGEEARTLGAVNDIVRRGGIRGIGSTLITQRPAVLNKDVLTQCGVLTTLRISHPKDMAAIREWVDVHSTREEADAMMKSLPSLPKGDAWVWAPGWPTDQGIFQRIRVRVRETFDSGATPKAGHTQKQPKVVAQIDLAKLGEQIQATVQRQKENDPKELKARIAKLERELEQKQTASPVIDQGAVERAVEKQRAADNEVLRAIVQDDQRLRDGLKSIIELCRGLYDPGCPVPVGGLQTITLPPAPAHAIEQRLYATPKHSPAPAVHLATIPVNGNGEKLPKAERTILTALAQYPQGRTKVQVALLGSYSHTGGGFNNALSALRGKGYIEGEETLRITQPGVKALGHFTPLPTGKNLLEHWYRQLGKAERSILESLACVWPRSASKEDVAAATGYEASGGGFNNALSRLRTFELISGKGELKASDDLF
jgi:hypothetical protein